MFVRLRRKVEGRAGTGPCTRPVARGRVVIPDGVEADTRRLAWVLDEARRQAAA